MRRLRLGLSVGLLCVLTSFVGGAGTASARVIEGRPDVPPVSDARDGLFAARRGVQGPAGMWHSRILLHINTSSDLVGKPISLAPDLYYAVTDQLQLGLLHNLPMGWSTLPGAGICLTDVGTDPGDCPHRYNNVGFDLMYGLLFGDFNLSLHSSFYLLQLDTPNWKMLTLGLTGKLHLSRDFAIFFDPQYGVAVGSRDAGNKDRFYLPIELEFQMSPSVVLKILTGAYGQVDGFGDNFRAPLGVGVIGNVNSTLDLGLRFSFDNMLGNRLPGVSRTQESSLSLLMHIRF